MGSNCVNMTAHSHHMFIHDFTETLQNKGAQNGAFIH